MNFWEPEEVYCPLGRDATAKMFDFAMHSCDSKGGCHGPDHIERVYRLTIDIGLKMTADLRILAAAALLHDIGRNQETAQQGKICHAEKGAEIAAPILRDMAFSQQFRDSVLHCIKSHRFRNSRIPVSLEAKILYDADKLDSIGAIGIGRAFLFAGQIGAKLHNSQHDIDHAAAYSLEDTAFREFTVKLSKVKDRMLTPCGKKMAADRHRFMEDFFHQLDMEIRGSC